MKKVILRYGLIAAVIVGGLMLLSFPMMKDPENYSIAEIFGFTSIILSLSTIFIAVKTYRDKYNEGKVKFGKAFLIGLYITLIAGTVYALTFITYDTLAGHPFQDFYRDHQMQEIAKENLGEAAKAEKIAELNKNIEMLSNPFVVFLVSVFVEYSPLGIVISLIAAAVLKRK